MKELLVITNMPSANTASLAEAIVAGANDEAISGVNTTLLDPISASADHVMHCDAIVIGTTENFGYMSGLIKDFFERIYYPCLEEKQGLPYSLYIRAGIDGSGTKIGVEKIISGLRWREVQPCLLLQGTYQTDFLVQCKELGMCMAAGLEAGII